MHRTNNTFLATILLALLLAVVASPATAQRSGQYELTPFGGYTFGGDFDVFDFEFGVVNFELDDSFSYGVLFDIPINRFLQIEIMAAQQSTDLVIDEGLFAADFEVAEVDVETLQVGVLWQANIGQAKPYLTAGLGIAQLDPDVPGLDTETRPAFSLGGGVKTFFTNNFGLRFDARLMVIVLDTDSQSDFDCCRFDDDSSDITQGQASVGFIIAF